MERMHIRGVLASDSAQVASKSRMHGSPYSGPKESKDNDETHDLSYVLTNDVFSCL